MFQGIPKGTDELNINKIIENRLRIEIPSRMQSEGVVCETRRIPKTSLNKAMIIK